MVRTDAVSSRVQGGWLPAIRWVLAMLVCGMFTWQNVAAQVVHPTIEFASRLLKEGQFDEAISTLKPRIDADPDNCQALGLLFVAYLQQRDVQRTKLWRERLQGVSQCAATADAALKLDKAVSQRAELAKALAAPIVQGDLTKIDELIGQAEQSLGPLPLVRAYVEALKGEFPALDNPSEQKRLPSAFLSALQKRKADLASATSNTNGSFVAGFKRVAFSDPLPWVNAALESEGYRVAQPLRFTFGAEAMAARQKWLAFHAEQVRREYELAPLREQTLTQLMTLAFLSGSSEQIDAVASTMARAFQKIAWIGSFFGSRKDWWDVGAVVSLDLKSRVIAYRPWLTVGSKAPRELLVEWTLPFADVRELSQPGIKFGVLAATGYRGLGPYEQGALLNGRVRLPLPANVYEVSLAYSELPVRQTIREYGAQLARRVGLPDAKVTLVKAAPGKGLSTFVQLWSAGATALGEATGRPMASAAPLADHAANLRQQDAAQQVIGAQAMDLWERASADGLLGQTLNIDDFAGEIDRLLHMSSTTRSSG